MVAYPLQVARVGVCKIVRCLQFDIVTFDTVPCLVLDGIVTVGGNHRG